MYTILGIKNIAYPFEIHLGIHVINNKNSISYISYKTRQLNLDDILVYLMSSSSYVSDPFTNLE